MATDISFLDMLDGMGSEAPAGGEAPMPPAEDTDMEKSPMDVLASIDISDIVDFLKSKEILPKDFTYEGEEEREEPEEMEGEETIDDSLSYDKLMME